MDDERFGTPEQIAVAEAAWRNAKASGASETEWRRMCSVWVRLCKFKKPRKKPPKMRMVATPAGEVALYDPVSDARSAYVMQEYTKLTEKYGPKLMEERLQHADPGVRHKALSELHDLLKAAYRGEQDAAPKRKAEPRKVVVRGWPSEGNKS